INLQTDWGKYAYGLDRMATLKDFDKWIDRVLSAEELRGGKLSSSNAMNAVKNPVQPSNSNRQLGSYTPGSSNYNNRGPTVLAGSLSNVTTLSDCPACKESPAHRLEMCNVFKRMLVNARASLCATNNHCFKCLVRGHYGRKCNSTESKCKECQGPHHSLLHGAERQFPSSSRNQGKNHTILMVKAPTANIRPVLLAIVKLVVEMNNSAQTTFAILDQGSEATLISRKLANLLKLKGPSASICFGSFNNSVLMD
ncbi:Uncharacterized protein APZ42_000827, partial [Daphnia magna]